MASASGAVRKGASPFRTLFRRFRLVILASELTDRLGFAQLMALAVVALACVFDLRARRIPNLLTFGGAGIAVLSAGASHGVPGLAQALGGWAVGLVVFLPLFILGGLGAGDVKLMACIGAWLGPPQVLWTALYAALAGGVAAVAVALATGYLRTAVDNVYMLLVHFRVAGIRPHPEITLERGKGPRLPYALPIAAGMAAAMWLH
jgi:prepilin peptidase CpaA